METGIVICGAFLVALVGVQLAVESASSLQGLLRHRRVNRLAQLLMLERIEAANARRMQQERTAAAWNGYRKFVVARKVAECDNICSFYLKPHDGKPLPRFQPGQYLTFQLLIPGRDQPVVRCYSLSDAPRSDYYRVTIKRLDPPPNVPGAPPGLSSSHFYARIQEGDLLDVKSPSGHFVVDPTSKRPAVMIAGGVGITPFVSMINAIADAGSAREVWLFYGVRHPGERVLKEHFRQLAREHRNFRLVIVYSMAGEPEHPGEYAQEIGNISLDLLRKYLPTSNYEFYVCGPPPMMEAIMKQLAEWGVPKHDVRSEAFGPATVKAKHAALGQEPPAAAAPPAAAQSAQIKVTFSRSGKTVAWTGTESNLLEFAEQNGVRIESGCRAGGCGSCSVAVKQGTVAYEDSPEYEIQEGCCLTCIGCPKSDLVIDA